MPRLIRSQQQNLCGYGLKLRPEHYHEILAQELAIDWFEIVSENYLEVGGSSRYYLEQISDRYPLTLHGVSMSLGGSDPLDYNYLHALKQLATEVNARHISDHLCWNSSHGINSHDLLPLPYTEETIKHVAQRISQVQDYLGQQILVENVSSYLSYRSSQLSEGEFIRAVAEEADCLLLLDLNNVYVSAINHKFNPCDYLQQLPYSRVAQIHLAGHSRHGDYLIDTHDAPICPEVWHLYQHTRQQLGHVPTLIERDANIPPLSELLRELNYARSLNSASYTLSGPSS